MAYAISVYPQSKESDKYFAKGVDAYNGANYTKAIKWFSKAKKLDEKQLQPNTYRKYYTDSWIAYCYYKLGNNTKAKEYSQDYYFIKPIDRRNTIASDKENDLASEAFESQNLEDALAHAVRCKELEANSIGKETLHYIGSCAFISKIYNLKNDYATTIEYCEEGLSLLKRMQLDTDPYTFMLLRNRVDAYLGQNILLLADNDILQMKRICEYQEVKNGNKLFTTIVKMLEGRIELLKKGDKNNVIKLATDAFKLLIDNYNPGNDAISIMIDCLNLLDRLGANKLQIELLESVLKKELTPLHRGVLLVHLAYLTPDTDTAIKFSEEANSLLKNGSYVNMYYDNLLLLADLYTT